METILIKLNEAFKNRLKECFVKNTEIKYSNIVDKVDEIKWIDCQPQKFDLSTIISGEDVTINFNGSLHANVFTSKDGSQLKRYGFTALGSIISYNNIKKEFLIKEQGTIVWDSKI